jgi:putative transposase
MWLWVAIIKSKDKEILGMSISKERNMFVVAERFMSKVVEEDGRHSVSTDGGTWYPQACKFLKLKHHIHLHTRKALSKEQSNIKDRISEEFDDHFPCRKQKCKLMLCCITKPI